MGRKRHGMSKAKSGKLFRKGAKSLHPKNNIRPTRGGIRL